MYPFSITSDRNMMSIGLEQLIADTVQRVNETEIERERDIGIVDTINGIQVNNMQKKNHYCINLHISIPE